MSRAVRRLENDERRSQLLAVGLELFSSTSFDNVSIDEIATRAGMSRGLLYHYFSSKRVFYVEVVRLAARELLGRLGRGAVSSPNERLRTDLAAYMSFVTEHRAGFETLLRGGIGSDREVQQVLDETRSAIVGHVLAGIEVDRPSASLEVALHGWVGFVESASLRWLIVPDEGAPSVEALVELFSRLLVTALEATADPVRA